MAADTQTDNDDTPLYTNTHEEIISGNTLLPKRNAPTYAEKSD